MRRLLRPAAVAAVAPLLLVLAGCGDDDSPSAEPSGSDDQNISSAPTSPTTSTTDAITETEDTGDTGDTGDAGDCQWLSADAVGDAVGVPMSTTAAGEGGCVFDPEQGDEPRVTVTYVAIQIDTQTYADGTRDTCEGPVTDVTTSLPDSIAFACKAFADQGFVFSGSDSVVVEVDGAADDDAGVAAAAELLASVTFG